MKHYDYIEWLLYKNGMLSSEKCEEMEQHLLECDTCMEIFLSLIDEKEEELAKELVPDDFTTKVIRKIPKTKIRNKKNKQQNSFYYQFGYYAAVASVTIILTLGGFYTRLVDAVPKVSTSIELTEGSSNRIFDFSNKIIDSTSSLLLSIEINNWREFDER
jgi:hypothetical protein